LQHLGEFPGDSWQQRWESSGLNGRGCPVRDLAATSGQGTELTQALEALISMRIIAPTLESFRANQFRDYPERFRIAQADPQLDAFFAAVAAAEASPHFRRRALFDVCTTLTTQGIAFADLTPEAFLHYARTTRDSGLAAYSYSQYVGHLAWKILHESGHFPPSAPPTLRAALRQPQLSTAELVDQYPVVNRPVRQLLIDYLERRSYDLDYSSVAGLATTLVLNFWNQIEKINPAQTDLRLSEQTYQQWRQALRLRHDGKPRNNEDGVLIAVRALYFDLQSWAAQEPERWAIWAAPCPIPSRETRAGATRRRRTRERMADRTRSLKPLLPLLVEHVEYQRRHTSELLTIASRAAADELIAVDSRLYRRLFTPGDRVRQRRHGQANVRVREESSGQVINLTLAEDTAFWSWAIIETLRHTGLRNEELLELSQLSIRQYQRPNGEVIALLVVAPSKSDRERVIPMSAELFHVIACIIRRLTRDQPTVPLSTRYDVHERITSEPQPFLFQRHIGQRNEVMTPGAVGEMLRRTCVRLADTHPQFAERHFTPHDFRRLFATDLVNHGLPIHIGAALLGHLNLETTRGYVAVFQEDVVRHYQSHLARRRAMRPEHEYQPVTDTEWTEFEEHFDKRKLELGNCGRPYATPCSHEHACIRCPMLQVDTKMIPRLNDIEADLSLRRKRAEDEGWVGEIEGLDLTLSFLVSKRTEAMRWIRRDHVPLGMPTAKRSAS
jgi:integrase